MRFILVLFIAVALVTLVAWAVLTVGGKTGRRTSDVRQFIPSVSAPQPLRPNVLFWLAGAIAAGVGMLMVIAGAVQVAEAMDHADPFGAEGAEAQADAASIFTWGVVILTNGVYLWRGARHRGSRDRIGRGLIVVGYLLLGVAMSQTIHSAVDLWAADQPAQVQEVLVETMVKFLGWGFPAALLVYLGARMANEEVILTSEASVGF